MRIYIYNIISFPSNVSIHVSNSFSTSQIFSQVTERFNNPKLTTIFDSTGHILEDFMEVTHGGIYFAYDKKELPEKFSFYVTQAHMDRVKILSKKETALDITQLVIIGLVTFYISWFLTEGGVTGALLICAYLAYACFRHEPEHFEPTLRHNVIRIIKSDRKLVYVALVWLVLKFSVQYLLPESNGTSPMLIIFSVSLSIFFVVPRILSWLFVLVRYRRIGPCYFFHPIRRHPYLTVVALLCLVLIVLSDVWFSSFLSMSLASTQCKPLLSNESKYFDNALNTFKKISSFIPVNLNQYNILEGLLHFSTKLGEVGCILPTLITLAVYTQFFVPKRYKIVQQIFFSAVLAQVFGGLVSAALKLSFPCGHATVTFATCYVFYQGIFAFIRHNRPTFQPSLLMKLAIGFVIFIFPTLTGLSRVAHCVHWASDVFAGVLLGICIGSWSVKDDFKAHDENHNVKVMLM